MRTDTPRTIYLKDYQPPLYKVLHTDLTFRIFEDRTSVTARTSFRKNHEGREPLVLNGEHLVLKSVLLDGKAAEHTPGDKFLTLPCPGEEFTLEIETEIDPASNTRLEGLYKSGGNWCTQCEAEGFRSITFYPDRPDVMAPFRVRIEADRETCPVLLSNGDLIEEGGLDGGRHYAVWDDPFPKPCYLFALVAGKLEYIQDFFTTAAGKKVDLRIYVRDGDQPQCGFAMQSLKHSMKWDEEKYGRVYDYSRFNIVAVGDFNMGAMENTSLNIFNTALVLASPETATDGDFERVEGVIAHEYFHNWTGNRITCRDWFQLSLKEGLTVFRDQEFSADMNDRDVKRIDDVAMLRRAQFAEDASPLAHPVRPDNYIEINNFYTVTVYEKGAELIRMQHTLLGPDAYRKATDLYFERHDGQAVTCDDFVQCMQDASGVDLSLFKLWYEQAGTPEISAKGFYDEKARTYTLELSQRVPPTPGQPVKKPMHIPVRVGLIGPNGADLPVGPDGGGSRILELREEKQSFVFENVSSRPVPSILRGFSAPVKLTTDLGDDELRFLAVHDSDGFNRWDAGQAYALRVMGRALDALEAGGEFRAEQPFVDAMGLLLEQALAPGAGKALIARALTLPDIGFAGQQRKAVDPPAIYRVRRGLMETVTDAHRGLLERIHAENAAPGRFESDAPARARRSLRNTALRYLGLRETETAQRQYDAANNMTDRVAALSVLAEGTSSAAAAAFADFYGRFRTHPLVIDKWFSLQAGAVGPDTLATVKTLRRHPDFNIRNPNRARALFGAFAAGNPACFHAADGGGYDFLADAVCELNGINPQIAARLLTPLREWRRYTPDRQAKMKAALERIAALPGLSSDVYEIVSKTLQ